MRARSWALLLLVLLLPALPACGGGAGEGAPATPQGLTAEPQDGAVLLGWSAAGPDVAGYVVTVFRSTGALVRTVTVPGTDTSTLVEGLVNGEAYSFRVAAEDAGGRRSAPSALVVATPAPAATVPATPTGLTALAQDREVLLTWNANTEADLAGYALHFGAAPGPLGESRDLPRGAVSTLISGLTNGVAYQFVLEAVDEAGARSPRTLPVTATPQANLAAPVVSGVELVGYGDSTQVRQGAGAITMNLQGERLEGLTGARVLGAFDLVVEEATATSARLSGVVPHGIEVGVRSLLVSSPGGERVVVDALEVTRITVAKTPGLNPSDETGLGTPNRPFLTLGRALSVAGEGDTVLLGAGTYGAGEVWPSGGVVPTPNVPAGVAIEGQSSDRGAVLLDGGGAPSTDGLAFAGSATVRNLSLRGFRYAMYALGGSGAEREGAIEVENVAAIDNLAGLWVLSTDSLDVRNSAFRNNSVGSASGWGLLVQGVRLVEVSDTEVIGNFEGLRLTTTVGVPSSATLDGLTVTDNAQDGIRVTSVSTFLRSSRVALNSSSGLQIEGRPPALQVGAGTVLEQNTDFQLWDLREAGQGTFPLDRNALPGAGLTIGPVIGPVSMGNFYSVSNAGNGFVVQ